MRRLPLVLLSAALGAGAAAAPASADVLVSAFPAPLVCGDPIVPGIWAQPGTTQGRIVRMKAVDRRTGKVWWRKTARARESGWREWTLPSGRKGRCGTTKFVYKGDGFTARYTIRFRSEGV